MKKVAVYTLLLSLVTVLVLGVFPAVAGKNGNGNGFPEGDHYNLNLIAKKSAPLEPGYFNCPSPDDYLWDYYMDGEGLNCSPDLIGTDACVKVTSTDSWTVHVPSGRNVIFVPRNQDDIPDTDISILIKSGSGKPGKGNKIKDTYPVLEVTDWCTEHFDDDPAEVMLPENANGYAVYARVTGKPVEGTAWSFMSPSIEMVQDEYGNALYYLGNVDDDGCVDANGDSIGLGRIDNKKGQGKGKGVKQATDLTCLFKFTGQVCYVNDLCYYCGESPDYLDCDFPFSLIDTAPFDFVCCQDTYDDGDPPALVHDTCGEIAQSNCVDPSYLLFDYTTPCNPLLEEDCQPRCLDGFNEIVPLCRDYQDTWVFNISDFVDVLWKSKSEGAYVIQLRFYPI